MLGKRNNVGFISAIGARLLERAVFDAKRGWAPTRRRLLDHRRKANILRTRHVAEL